MVETTYHIILCIHTSFVYDLTITMSLVLDTLAVVRLLQWRQMYHLVYLKLPILASQIRIRIQPLNLQSSLPLQYLICITLLKMEQLTITEY